LDKIRKSLEPKGSTIIISDPFEGVDLASLPPLVERVNEHGKTFYESPSCAPPSPEFRKRLDEFQAEKRRAELAKHGVVEPKT
jgi:hypothetical protein